MEQRRAEGTYKEDMRDYIDVFLHEIDTHAHLGNRDNENINYYTGKRNDLMSQSLSLRLLYKQVCFV